MVDYVVQPWKCFDRKLEMMLYLFAVSQLFVCIQGAYLGPYWMRLVVAAAAAAVVVFETT
jgi:hypothetical protein